MTTPPKDQAPDALRAHFEALASDPSFKLSRSRRGTYVNPAVARDWKWFQLGASQAQQPAPTGAPVWQGKWAWVPVEPSTAMLIAGNHGQPGEFSALKVWQDMLQALQRSSDYTRPVDPPIATAESAQAAAYSLDADPQNIRARVAEAITGALAFGAQGANPPPDGHWLAPFWEAARKEAIRAPAESAGRDAEDAALWRRMIQSGLDGDTSLERAIFADEHPEPTTIDGVRELVKRAIAVVDAAKSANGDPTP